MSDPRLQSTPEDVFAGRAVPAEMLQDFLKIAALEPSTCAAIVDSLRNLVGLADTTVLRERISATGVESDAIESVIRAVKSIRPNQLTRYLKTVAEWVKGSEDRSKLFTPVLFRALQTNLGQLIQESPSIELMHKAEQLLRDVGNEIQDIKFVCDLRPVFDKPRDTIEGFVLVTTLRLIYQLQHGERQSIEIAFSEDELQLLHTELIQAQKKLERMKELRPILNDEGRGQE